MNQITENLLEVNQSMINASINNLRFDKTEIATVVNVLDEGYYQVFNGKVKYQAKVLNDAKFLQNDQVYVSIKEGDYSLEKTIIGKYDISKPEEQISIYEDPFDRLAINQTLTVLENQENKWVWDNENNQWKQENFSFSITGLGQPTYFGSNISLETNSNFTKYPEASFGLIVELIDEKGVTINSISIESQYIVGNIYNLTSDLKHKNIYKLPSDFNIEKVKSITVKPFVNNYGDSIEWHDIILYFGYDNKDERIVSSNDKVFIDTNTGFKMYNTTQISHEVFNTDLEKNITIGTAILPQDNQDGNYNNDTLEKNWNFYNYNGNDDTLWNRDWQRIWKEPITDEQALNMNMPTIEDNEAFHLCANTSFLAYPLELDNIDINQYRNCFGFLEEAYTDNTKSPKQYYKGEDKGYFCYLNYNKSYWHEINHGLGDNSNIRNGNYYHFKINLETEEERVDLRDKAIGPIDSDYIDFKVIISITGKGSEASLRIDAPRDLNYRNNKTLKILKSWSRHDLTLRYYSKNYSLNYNFSSYLTETDETQLIVHIPYGALVWLAIKTSGQGSTAIQSEYPLEDNIIQPLTARIKFNHFISTNAIYRNNYYADKVGIYKVPIEDFENTDTRKYFGPDSQKIGITNLYETLGEWSEYYQDFIVDYGYKYYFGLMPQFGGFTNVQNNVIYPNIYIDNLSLYTLEPIELTTLYGTWIKDNNVYSKLHIPTDKTTVVEWYQKTPNYEGEPDGIGPWWKKIVKNNKDGNITYEQDWNLEVNKYLSNSPSETFKFVVKREEEKYISEDLVLTNKGYVIPRETTTSEGLEFTINDDGIYLYDYTGNIHPNEETKKTLTVSAIAGETELKEDDIIAWLIPKNSTMIQEPYLLSNETEIDGNVQKEYYWECSPEKTYDLEPKLEDFNSDLQGGYTLETLNSYYVIEKQCTQDNLSLTFRIKTLFQPNAVNNDILVYVFDGNNLLSQKYAVSKFTPKFIATNNAGAEGSLGIELLSSKGYLGADNTEDIKLKATVYDNTGVPLAIQPKVTWETGGAPTDIYNGYWANSDSGKQINANTIEVYKPNLQYQVILKANNYSTMTKALLVSEYPKIYSIKYTKENDSGKMIQLKQDLCRQEDNHCLWADLYMLTEDDDYPNLGNNTIYFLTKNQELIVHYVYDIYDKDRQINFPTPNRFDTTIDPTQEPDKALYICNVYKNFTFNNETKISTFIPFEYKDNDFSVIKLSKEQNRYAYVLNEKIKEVYIKIAYGSSDKFAGAMPYVNFLKTGTDTAKFQMDYIANSSNGNLDKNNISTENNTLTLSNKIKIPLIIKAKCEWQRNNNQKVLLSSYYTIPYFSTNQKYDLDGRTSISYSAFGTNPLLEEKYQVYRVTDKGRESIDNYFFEVTSINSQIKSEDKMIIDENGNIVDWRHNLSFPQIAPAEEEIGTLDIYITSEWEKESPNSLTKIPKKYNLEPVAKFPLILYRNSYAFKEINGWDGASTTVQDTYIISPMIAAGTKNNNNQFTGVMMGTHTNFPSTGLYGFQNGVATFGFKEDGSCFLGANEETGRIEFNTGDSGGEMIINAKINRISSFDFKKNYKYSTGTAEIIFDDKQSLNYGTYFNDVLFTGLSFICKDEKSETIRKGIIGNTLGYSSSHDVDTDIVRDIGFIIRNETNSGFSLSSKGNLYLIASNSNFIGANTSLNKFPSGSAIYLDRDGDIELYSQNIVSIYAKARSTSADFVDSGYKAEFGIWNGTSYINHIDGKLAITDGIFFNGIETANDFIVLEPGKTEQGGRNNPTAYPCFHFDFNDVHVRLCYDGIYYGKRKVVAFPV